MQIDTHQHFWKFDPVRDGWITKEMSVIQRDFLPEDLQPLLKKNNFDGCIAVQADQSEKETNFLLELAKQNDFIKGIVGWIDLQHENIKERLSYYKQFRLVKGFRHILQGERDRTFMLKPEFMRGIGALKEFGFTYDILIFPDQLQYTKKLVAAFPDQGFVIDHIAKPDIRNRKITEWKQEMAGVAQYENVYCKLSGLVTESGWTNWKEKDFAPYLDAVVESFGTSRILFGSDWPVCLLAASYKEVVDILKHYFASFTKNEQQLFFGGNAIKFYQLT
ncbi:MAG TPA: amidohydrolase family protein [Chitinophagaceae bacterium]|nr:amidohydrolase family protein [Chitinophagaceae bacterium]